MKLYVELPYQLQKLTVNPRIEAPVVAPTSICTVQSSQTPGI